MTLDKTKSQLIKELQQATEKIAALEHSTTLHKSYEKNLRTKIDFEKFISSFSKNLLSADTLNNSVIDKMIKSVCTFAKAERAFVFWRAANGLVKNTNEYCVTDIEPKIDHFSQLKTRDFHYWSVLFSRAEAVVITKIDDMDKGAKAEKDFMLLEGIKSLLLVPMIHKTKNIGFFGVESFTEEIEWSEDIVSMMQILSNLLATAFERDRMAKIISNSETQLIQVVANMPVMAAALDSDNNFLAVNKEFERVTGYSSKELLTNKSRHKMHEVMQSEDSPFKSNTNVKLMTIACKDGSIKNIEWSTSEIKISFLKWVTWGVGIDVTEKKNATDGLLRSESKFRLLAEKASDVIWTLDNDFNFNYVSPSIERVFGFSVQEALEKKLFEIMPPESMEQMMNAFGENSLNGNNNIGPIEVEQFKADGTRLWTDITIVMVKDENGNIIHIQGITRDISERKKWDQTLLNYQEQLKKLASDLVKTEERERNQLATKLHDGVCQLLASIKIQLSLLPDEAKKLPNFVIAMKLLGDALHDAKNLTQELSPPILYQLGLAKTIQRQLDIIKSQTKIKTEFIESGLEYNLSKDIKVLLFRIIRELLVNVTKHAKASKVSVSVLKKRDSVVITVADDGIGFEEQAKEEGKFNFGLFSVREQISYLDGELKIESEAGKGTSIVVSLPLKE